jgi:hypothetical protein
MNRPIEPSVDEALRTLAADDRQVVVPPRVHASVMRAWDARVLAPSGESADRAALVRRVALVAGVAALVVFAVLFRGDPPRVDETAGRELGYVLVPDPMADPASLQVVRLRMPRTGLATLGVPLANPEAEGVVELELLVGEDGVARAIRRAALVTTAEMSGRRRR